MSPANDNGSDASTPSSTNNAPTADSDSNNENQNESRTTVLSPGTVESRNYASSQKISSEIRAFLSGTDGNDATLGPKSEFRTFFTIWMFITRLPSPSWIDLHPGFLMRGMSYFPMVGSVLGVMYAIVFDMMDVSIGLPSNVSAALAIGFGLYITGCFHEDGLADSADGLGGGWSKSQVLKIMTDSRVGTFGVAALGLFLFVKLQLLGFLSTSHWKLFDILENNGNEGGIGGGGSSGAGPAILVAQTYARLSAPYLIRTRDYIAEVGPKSPFYRFMVEAKHIVSWPRVFIASTYCFVLSAMLYGPVFASVVMIAVLALAHLAGNKGDYLLGGVMGDFLGGTICICEVMVLILIVAKDSIVETYHIFLDVIISSVHDRGGLSTEPLSIVAALYGCDRIRPLFHFAILVVTLKMWCSFVGPPDMYTRDDDEDVKNKNKKE